MHHSEIWSCLKISLDTALQQSQDDSEIRTMETIASVGGQSISKLC